MPCPQDEITDAQAIFGALVEGLRITDAKLNKKCSLALALFGGRALPQLVAAANGNRTRSGHRKRLTAVIDRIDDRQEMDGQVSWLVVDALLDGLRVDDDVINNKATEAIGRLPPDMVNRLILEAACNRRKPGYCIRLLKAAEKFEQRPQVSQLCKLLILASDKDAGIRQQAQRLIVFFSPAYEGWKEANCQPIATGSA